MKNKKGWIRVVEVFIALMMITSVSLIMINSEYKNKNDTTSAIYSSEISILREIQWSGLARGEILESEEIPVEWENFPETTKEIIESETPDYLMCKAMICEPEEVCEMNDLPSGKDIYVQSVLITANSEIYNLRVLKLFCWRR